MSGVSSSRRRAPARVQPMPSSAHLQGAESYTYLVRFLGYAELHSENLTVCVQVESSRPFSKTPSIITVTSGSST